MALFRLVLFPEERFSNSGTRLHVLSRRIKRVCPSGKESAHIIAHCSKSTSTTLTTLLCGWTCDLAAQQRAWPTSFLHWFGPGPLHTLRCCCPIRCLPFLSTKPNPSLTGTGRVYPWYEKTPNSPLSFCTATWTKKLLLKLSAVERSLLYVVPRYSRPPRIWSVRTLHVRYSPKQLPATSAGSARIYSLQLRIKPVAAAAAFRGCAACQPFI
jgi:hypothetical protein